MPDMLKRHNRAMFSKQLNKQREVNMFGACSALGIGTGPRNHGVLAGRIPESRGPYAARGPRV